MVHAMAERQEPDRGCLYSVSYAGYLAHHEQPGKEESIYGLSRRRTISWNGFYHPHPDIIFLNWSRIGDPDTGKMESTGWIDPWIADPPGHHTWND